MNTVQEKHEEVTAGKSIFSRVRSGNRLFSTEEIAQEELRTEKEQSHSDDANDHRGEE